MSEFKSDSEAVVEVMKGLHGHQVVGLNRDQCQVMVLPKGMRVHSMKDMLDEYRDHPERREGTATLGSLESFVVYANRFRNEHSVVFAERVSRESNGSVLQVVIDHHQAGADGEARHGKHRGRYMFPFSDEWRAWKAADGVAMDQEEFAEFLEDRLFDVRDPESSNVGSSAAEFARELAIKLASASKLRDLGKGLAVTVGQNVAQKHNMSTGESTIQFSEEHQDATGQPLIVPGGFVVGIPVFDGGAMFQLCVRLRYRIIQGSIQWTVKIHRPEKVHKFAFDEACDLVANETTLPVLQGSPEA